MYNTINILNFKPTMSQFKRFSRVELKNGNLTGVKELTNSMSAKYRCYSWVKRANLLDLSICSNCVLYTSQTKRFWHSIKLRVIEVELSLHRGSWLHLKANPHKSQELVREQRAT